MRRLLPTLPALLFAALAVAADPPAEEEASIEGEGRPGMSEGTAEPPPTDSQPATPDPTTPDAAPSDPVPAPAPAEAPPPARGAAREPVDAPAPDAPAQPAPDAPAPGAPAPGEPDEPEAPPEPSEPPPPPPFDPAILEPAARTIADELMARAVTHSLDADWIAARVAHGITPARDARWVELLRPFGPTELALSTCKGVSAVTYGTDYVRVVLGCRPLLSILVRKVDEEARLSAIELTTCVDCDERERFVADLIVDVQRSGRLGDRLAVGFELVPGDPKDAGKQWQTWAALAESRMRADHSLAAAIGGAVITGNEDGVIRLRYPDGTDDTWRIAPTPRGWAVEYDELAGNSPLRLSSFESKRWRKSSVRQQAALDSWRPLWRPTDGGAGHVLGSDALAVAFDPHDDTLVTVLVDRDIPLAAVVVVDPATQVVLQRLSIPIPDSADPVMPRDGVPVERVAFDPSTRRVAFAAHGRLWLIDREAATVREAARVKDVRSLDWSNDLGAFVWGTSAGAFGTLPTWWKDVPALADPVAAQVDTARIAAFTHDGALTRWWPVPPPPPATPPPATPPAAAVDPGAAARPEDLPAADEEPIAGSGAALSDGPLDPDAAGAEAPPANETSAPGDAPTAEPTATPTSAPPPPPPEPVTVRVCPETTRGAARDPVRGSWLVVCGPGEPQSFAIVRMPGALVEPMGDRGTTSPAAAWSTASNHVAVPAAPELEAGVVIWDFARGVPWTVLGRQPPVSLAFSADGGQLAAALADGTLVVWDTALAHRRFPVPVLYTEPR